MTVELPPFGDILVDPPVLPAVVEVDSPESIVELLPVPGVPGPRGPAGDGGFSYVQADPSATWIIPHGLGRWPSSTTVIVDNHEVTADVEYPDIETVTVTFARPAAGRAEIV